MLKSLTVLRYDCSQYYQIFYQLFVLFVKFNLGSCPCHMSSSVATLARYWTLRRIFL